jgi:hypothetical protein
VAAVAAVAEVADVAAVAAPGGRRALGHLAPAARGLYTSRHEQFVHETIARIDRRGATD